MSQKNIQPTATPSTRVSTGTGKKRPDWGKHKMGPKMKAKLK